MVVSEIPFVRKNGCVWQNRAARCDVAITAGTSAICSCKVCINRLIPVPLISYYLCACSEFRESSYKRKYTILIIRSCAIFRIVILPFPYGIFHHAANVSSAERSSLLIPPHTVNLYHSVTTQFTDTVESSNLLKCHHAFTR